MIRSTGIQDDSIQKDLEVAISTVRAHDPAAFLPGALLPTRGRLGYFGVRAFWVETGLRMSHLPAVGATNYDVSRARSRGGNGGTPMTPEERLRWWRRGIRAVYEKDDEDSASMVDAHPVLRLLRYAVEKHSLSAHRFDCVLDGRDRDVNMKQYLTVDDLVQHSTQSCGSLLNLTLQCLDVHHDDDEAAHEAARLIGTCHGLTNALRMSVPMVSNTGKIIIPQELCDLYGIRSPRFLLSALGQGDDRCVEAMQSAVKDISDLAREYLAKARRLRPNMTHPDSVRALLPGLAAETFLNRLEVHGYDLTSKNLRQVGPLEHALCASRTIVAKYKGLY